MSTKLFLAFLLFAALPALAQEPVVSVEWDPVNDTRVGVYVVGIGEVEGDYTTFLDTTETTLAIPDLSLDTYHISVKACKADESVCSEWAIPIAYENPIEVPGNLRKVVEQLQSATSDVNNAVDRLVFTWPSKRRSGLDAAIDGLNAAVADVTDVADKL